MTTRSKELAEDIVNDPLGFYIDFDDAHKVAKAYLDLLAKQEGHVLVPLEPTEEMIKVVQTPDFDLSCFALRPRLMRLEDSAVINIYRAMITKAQEE